MISTRKYFALYGAIEDSVYMNINCRKFNNVMSNINLNFITNSMVIINLNVEYPLP